MLFFALEANGSENFLKTIQYKEGHYASGSNAEELQGQAKFLETRAQTGFAIFRHSEIMIKIISIITMLLDYNHSNSLRKKVLGARC